MIKKLFVFQCLYFLTQNVLLIVNDSRKESDKWQIYNFYDSGESKAENL